MNLIGDLMAMTEQEILLAAAIFVLILIGSELGRMGNVLGRLFRGARRKASEDTATTEPEPAARSQADVLPAVGPAAAPTAADAPAVREPPS